MTEVKGTSGLLSSVKLHVDDTGGSGRPVVLIHGWPLSGESWSEQVAPLSAAGYRVVRYDRRGFGRSDKPSKGFDYDTLAEDLSKVLDELDLEDVTLVGFSMGGGEVARYVAAHGERRLRSVVFAAAVTPYLMQGDDNPDGPLTEDVAAELTAALTADRETFFDGFMTAFFSSGGVLKVTESQRQEALRQVRQAPDNAVLTCMQQWATTDFRSDLAAITVPALVLHGDGDATVPFEGSGARTHVAIPHSELVVIPDGPHGINVSHADAFNTALLEFLRQ
jgi:pimeloyl-ACP methyl ester carboxylesterase